MRRIMGFLAMAALTAAFTTAIAAEQDGVVATIKLSAGSAAAGLGVNWGSGTLTYQGKDYPISVRGLSVGSVGISKIEASGNVYNLKGLADFDGNYTGVAAGAAVAGGAGAATLKNQNGVTVNLVSTTQGVQLTVGGGGVEMKLKEKPATTD